MTTPPSNSSLSTDDLKKSAMSQRPPIFFPTKGFLGLMGSFDFFGFVGFVGFVFLMALWGPSENAFAQPRNKSQFPFCSNALIHRLTGDLGDQVRDQTSAQNANPQKGLVLPRAVFQYGGHRAPIRNLQFAPHDRGFLSNDKKSIVNIYPLGTPSYEQGDRGLKNQGVGERLSTFQLPSRWILNSSFSHDGQFILTVTSDRKIQLWENPLYFIEHDPLNTWLQWNKSKEALTPLRYEIEAHKDVIRNAFFTPNDEQFVSIGHDARVKIWDTATGTIAKTIRLDSKGTAMAMSPNGHILVTGTEDSGLFFWDFDQQALMHFTKAGSRGIQSLYFSPNSRLLLSINRGGMMNVWNSYTGALRFRLPSISRTSSQGLFSPNNEYLVTSSDENFIEFWNMADGKLIKNLRGHIGPINAMAFTHDSRHLLTASEDGTIRVWSLPQGQLLHTLTHHRGPVTALAVSANDDFFISASEDKSIIRWNLEFIAE